MRCGILAALKVECVIKSLKIGTNSYDLLTASCRSAERKVLLMKGKKKLAVVVCLFVAFMLALIAASGCAPRAATEAELAIKEPPAFQIKWTPDSECGVCHNTQDLSRSDAEALVGNHIPPVVGEELACISCHTDEAKLTDIHKDATANPNTKAWMKFTQVPTESCTTAGCHDNDEAERIAATAELTMFTDLNGRTVNPHDMPKTEGHLKDVTCSDCHKGHTKSTPEAMCKGCHHDNVYECYTCHD
jgi:hypothetical protein